MATPKLVPPSTPCHILVEGNPVLVYASRNGTPDKVLPTLNRFLETFWQERDLSQDVASTPECLVAQIVVRFGFEICEDDYSNLRVGVQYDPDVAYLYSIGADRQVRIWQPEPAYRTDPGLGLQACREVVEHSVSSPAAN